MTQAITPGRLALLQLVVKYPGIARAKLLAIKGVGPADLAYLLDLELMQEREPGCYRATHRGETLVRRGL